MKLKNMILGAFLAVAAVASPAHADATKDNEVTGAQSVSQGGVKLYGHELFPAEVETDDLVSWDELEPLVAEIFTDADDEVSVEEMCTRVFIRHDEYRDAVEPRREELIAKFAEVYHGKHEGNFQDFPQKIVGDIASPSMDGVNQLIEDYPKAEAALLKMREVTFKWMALERLHDAAIEKCPEFTRKIGRSGVFTMILPEGYEEEGAVEQPSPDVPKP